MMRSIGVLCLAVPMVLGVGVGTAAASTTEIVPGTPNKLQIVGAGESNNVEIQIIAGEIRVEDTTGVTPGPGCSPDPGLDPNLAFCTLVGTEAVSADLGAGLDQFFSFVACNNPNDPFDGNYDIDGGPDADFLSAGSGSYSGGTENDVFLLSCAELSSIVTTVDGGDGDDFITATANQDVVTGGQGDDTLMDPDDFLVDMSFNRDTFDGGPGEDTISYATRTRKIKADLRIGRGGNRSERDQYIGVENLTGGDYKDVLFGDDNNNELRGGGESDKLVARDGNDELFGNDGYRDMLDGGDGDDLLDTLDGLGNDILRCKDGIDSYAADVGDRPHRNCENALP
jgi:Ca2+-binding RTX toxin-like protein